MFDTEEKIRKNIITSEGEDEFNIRYFTYENAGVVTARSGKAYFILDSIDYWYELIREKYPPKKKCRCKNDFFKLYFDYVPRVGTNDYRRVELFSRCTECGRERKFAEADIDCSPTEELFTQPLTFVEKPKIKYKTYQIKGYWKEEDFYGLIDFLSQKLMIYCYYWEEHKRHINKFTGEELKKFLFEDKKKYLCIYFSAEPLEELFAESFSDGNGIYIEEEIWRKRETVEVYSPAYLGEKLGGYCYSASFCSEYLEEGQVKAKSERFCRLTEEILEFYRERLK